MIDQGDLRVAMRPPARAIIPAMSLAASASGARQNLRSRGLGGWPGTEKDPSKSLCVQWAAAASLQVSLSWLRTELHRRFGVGPGGVGDTQRQSRPFGDPGPGKANLAMVIGPVHYK